MLESKFLSELETRDLDDDRCELLSDLVYRSRLFGGIIKVPRGFVSDKASVPRVPIVYTIWGDRSHREAVVHDWLYQTHLTTKKMADHIFLEAMEARNKSWRIRWPMYIGVMLAGQSSYDSGPKRFTILGNQTPEFYEKFT
mgnify:CR=1 FL=1